MSITEIQGPLSAAVKREKPIFGNLPAPEKKKTRVAGSVVKMPSRSELETELDNLYKMGIPPGPAGNSVYFERQKNISRIERQLRRMGVDVDSEPDD